VISTFLLGHGGKKVTLIILEKKVLFALGYSWKEILYGIAQTKE
jgi:hypothetical protein